MSTPDASKPTLKQLLGLAWPVVISRSSQVVVGVADSVMVASLGEAALAATTTGAFNSFSLIIWPMGVVFIVGSFASQFFGQGDLAGARRYGMYGLGVAFAAQLLVVPALVFLPTALAAFDYAPDVQKLITEYMRIRLLSTGIAVGMEALAGYYGGLGNTRLPMLANVLAMVLNVFANWVFIYGNLGAPAMGVAGAAWGSVISTAIAFAVLLACFVLGVGAPKPGARSPLVLAEFLRMLRFGVPAGFNWFFEFLAFAFFVNVVVAGLGTTSLAAFMAVMQLNSVAFMPAFGLASAGAIIVGQAIGKKAHDDVPLAVRLTLQATCVWQGTAGLCYLLLPELLLAPFVAEGQASSDLLLVGRRVLMLSAAWQVFDAAANTMSEALRAAGDTSFTLWARMGLAWLFFAPGAYVTVHHLGGGDLSAVAWVVAYIGALAAILWLRFRGGAWRSLDLTGQTLPAH